MTPNKDTLNWEVSGTQTNQRLDKLLAEQFPNLLSREQIKHWIQTECVLVNNQPVTKPAFKPAAGDAIRIHIPPVEPINLPHEDLGHTGLTIIYEDDDMLVVNKPSGMLTHPAGSQLTGTLVNGLLHHCNGQLSSENSAIRPGIVHRLDRFTSGLLMVAKTNQAHRHLAQQLKDRTAHRQYVAITHGIPPTPSGTIDAPLARDPHRRDQQRVDPNGRHAVTHWIILERGTRHTALVQFKLETGRTHQIRVHCQYKGFPIVGDPQYGDGFDKVKHLNTKGQLLQAQHLKFIHPVTNQLLTFSIPFDPDIERIWHHLNPDL